jgi:hypothetical protein
MSERTPRVHITWQISNDGLRPTEVPWGYVLRNPLARSIPPKHTMEIDLQVAANYPMLAFPARAHADSVTVPQIIPAGQDVVIRVENKSEYSPLIIEDKEALVNLFPLVAAPTTSEVG